MEKSLKMHFIEQINSPPNPVNSSLEAPSFMKNGAHLGGTIDLESILKTLMGWCREMFI